MNNNHPNECKSNSQTTGIDQKNGVQKIYYSTGESGCRIKDLRTKHGYTQEDLAKRLGVDRSSLSRIESGQKGCSVDMFIMLSAELDVSLDYLILGANSELLSLKQDIRCLVDQLLNFEKKL